MKPINYLSDQAADWRKDLTDANTLERLQALCNDYKYLCYDVLQIVEKMTPSQFKRFRSGLLKERGGKFAGIPWAEKYSAIIMPIVLFKVSGIEHHFKVPWGCAFLRMKQAGVLKEVDGHIEIMEKT